ncbi:hypothetical protein BHE74_00006658 [Ensete ventricosum]|nr:hypothetical protein GW17_00045114 [Ensete ventricosum]RWW84724.1 hypothetical protein BHE74_00006658 [Ensete ventricosum]RZR79965.1 hypothetical protein BHM03_00005843 [Ensete ventricosum]
MKQRRTRKRDRFETDHSDHGGQNQLVVVIHRGGAAVRFAFFRVGASPLCCVCRGKRRPRFAACVEEREGFTRIAFFRSRR